MAERRDWRGWLRRRTAVCVVLLAVASLLGLGGGWWWVLDLANHGRVHAIAAAVVLAACAGVAGSRRWTAIALAVLAGNAALVAPLWIGDGRQAGAAVLRLAEFNVHTANQDADAVVAWLRQADPEVAVLLEVDARWVGRLDALADRYPVRIHEPREDNFGISVLARVPVAASEVRHLAEVPAVVLRLAGEGAPTVIAAHVLPPVSAAYAADRDRQLGALASMAAAAGPRAVLCGDLNTTPWSPHFRALLAEGRLHDGRRGHGLLTTWPARPWFLRLPIDHVLAGDGLVVQDLATGPWCGSDHRGLLAGVSLAR